MIRVATVQMIFFFKLAYYEQVIAQVTPEAFTETTNDVAHKRPVRVVHQGCLPRIYLQEGTHNGQLIVYVLGGGTAKVQRQEIGSVNVKIIHHVLLRINSTVPHAITRAYRSGK